MNKGIPRYKALYELLRQRIEDGTYQNGDLLPSENELAGLHDMTRPTVRKALELLFQEGFIQKQQGRGSIVMGKPVGIGILSFYSTTSVIGEERLETRIIVKPEIRPWASAFSFEISDLEKELGCIYMERLRLVDGRPIFYDITMIPNINMPRFTARKFENRSLFNILRKHYQIKVMGGEQKIFAITADEKIRQYFRVQEHHPILKLDRKLRTSRPGFCFYSQIRCNTAEDALYGTF